MIDTIRAAVADSLELQKSFFRDRADLVAQVAGEIARAFAAGNKVMLFGNGGSAADAQHLAAEWVGRFRRERPPLPALALGTDPAIVTPGGNDYGFEQVFARQLRALGRAGDVAVALSTSGRSPDVLAAVDAALEMGLVTVGLTGGGGGALGSRVRYHLNVPHPVPARVQEVHILIGHLLCQLTEDALAPEARG